LVADAKTGMLLDANPAAIALLARSLEEIRTLHQSDVHAREDHAAGRAAFENRRHISGVTEHIILRGDGTRVSVEISASPMRGPHGEELVLGIFHDLTERNQASEELRLSEARLRAITDSANDAIVMMNPRGEITYWNPAAESILGYPGEMAMGKDLHGLLAPERYHPAIRGNLPGFAATGRGNAVGETIELTARRLDGSEVPIDLSLSAVNLKGEWHAVGVIRDVTQRKRYESELILAREQAEAAAHAKGVFLAAMSHELRTPLNAVLGFAELMEEDMGDRGVHDWDDDLHKIKRAGNHLLSVINDVLDFSAIEADKVELVLESVAVKTLIEDVAANSQPLASKNRTSLQVLCEPATLYIDRMRLGQCLFNLLGNACKFTHDGHVLVEGVFEPEWYMIRVVDTGIGIRAGDIDKLFTDFTQLDNSTTRAYGGSGLGLAISRRLARLMGGDITVESEEGRGSTFTLRIPQGREP